jgi:L-aminopeptidase/D-esterase-like protein
MVETTLWSPDEKSRDGDSIFAMSSASNRRRSSLKRTATFAGALNVIHRSTVIVDRSCCASSRLNVDVRREGWAGTGR